MIDLQAIFMEIDTSNLALWSSLVEGDDGAVFITLHKGQQPNWVDMSEP